MSTNALITDLSKLLADTYALYLKTQNYHWHVKGPNFKTLHELFEDQYKSLAEAVDDVAERILTLGGQAPASFSQFNELSEISDGNSKADSNTMVRELAGDHTKLITRMKQILESAQKANDEGTVALLSERIAEHEKTHWMLSASQS